MVAERLTGAGKKVAVRKARAEIKRHLGSAAGEWIQARPRPISLDAVEKELLEKLRRHEEALASFSPKKRQGGVLASLVVRSGLLSKEVVSLERSQVERSGGIVTAGGRRLNKRAGEVLFSWIELRTLLESNEVLQKRVRVTLPWATSPFVFPSPVGGKLSLSAVNNALSRAGLPKGWSPTALRQEIVAIDRRRGGCAGGAPSTASSQGP